MHVCAQVLHQNVGLVVLQRGSVPATQIKRASLKGTDIYMSLFNKRNRFMQKILGFRQIYSYREKEGEKLMENECSNVKIELQEGEI